MRLFRRLFVPDTHAPFHDKRAFDLMLRVVRDFKPDEIVILGDFFDCYSVSFFDKEPQKTFKLLKDEIDLARQPLNALVSASKCRRFVFLAGNHEHRITRYINTYSGLLSNHLSERAVLDIPKSWIYLPYGQDGHYKMGNWVATHGSATTKHVASTMLNKYGTNVIFGHVHRIQHHITSNFHGEVLQSLTPGWLGNMKRAAEYIKGVADWCHGFAVGYFDSKGFGHITSIPIIKYTCVFNGKRYSS